MFPNEGSDARSSQMEVSQSRGRMRAKVLDSQVLLSVSFGVVAYIWNDGGRRVISLIILHVAGVRFASKVSFICGRCFLATLRDELWYMALSRIVALVNGMGCTSLCKPVKEPSVHCHELAPTGTPNDVNIDYLLKQMKVLDLSSLCGILWPTIVASSGSKSPNQHSESLLEPFGAQGQEMLQMSLLIAFWGSLAPKARICSR